MKKLVFTLCLFCTLQNATAQLPELLETDWYVSHVVLDGVTYPTPLVNLMGLAVPNIEFQETIAYAVVDPESDSFFSDITYDPNDFEFTFLNPAITLPGCQAYCDFAIVYFGLLFGDGENVLFTYEIVITDNGALYLTITDEAGNYAFYQDSPILSTDAYSLSNIKVFPNPTTDVLFIASEVDLIETLAVYPLTGKKVLEQTNIDNSINVSALPQGMYFLVVTSENGRAVQKFIKE